MKFNRYVWELYKESKAGKTAIDDFKSFIDVKKKSDDGDDESRIVEIFYSYFSQKTFQIEFADEIFDKWISEGIHVDEWEVLGQNADELWWEKIELISSILYFVFPEFFIPYVFPDNFDQFKRICDGAYIALPEIPKKRYKRKRTLYYVEICKVLYEFRILHGLTPEELLAFIYDFIPNSLAENIEETTIITSPAKVWYVGGGDFEFLDHAKSDEVCFWQSNIDTRVGDIIIMYCWSPRSYIHSVWRAANDGYIDPFFYYYSITSISDPIKVPPITFREIKANEILSQSPIVKNNFQGVNGYPVPYKEYGEMLKLWAEKGMDISILPEIEPIRHLSDDVVLKDERDVEVYLLEPLLLKLDYKATDWIRQMPVRMGRGERFYPDYCLGAVSKRGEESAKLLFEAKYSIKNQKNLKDAYFQAKSYAIRLQARKFVLVSKEGLWVFETFRNSFELEKNVFYTWNDIENPDIFYRLMSQIGKGFKK